MAQAYNASSYLEEAKELLLNIKEEQDLSQKAVELAALLMRAANLLQDKSEKRKITQLRKALENPSTKAFIYESLDLAFRSNKRRTAKEISKTISYYGFPHHLSLTSKALIYIFHVLCKRFSFLFINFSRKLLLKNYAYYLIPGEKDAFEKFLNRTQKEKNFLNLAYINEDALGENNVKEQMNTYINYLSNPSINYLSIKISSISSKTKVQSPQSSLESLCENLRKLYRVALKTPSAKFINIDMENYKYFQPIIEAFQKVLNEEEFLSLYAGITLQAYLPNAYPIQRKLTKWAKNRVKQGGSPIKIHLVKGAYLSYEQVISSRQGWPQAPYLDKISTDANFKRMIDFGFKKENIGQVHLGICTHNIFDLAYALVLRSLNSIENYVDFHLLYARTGHIKKVLLALVQDKLKIYSPVFLQAKTNNTIYYLHRRLEENTGLENFLRFVPNLSPGNEDWENLEALFLASVEKKAYLSSSARRSFGKKSIPISTTIYGGFENEPCSDFALPSKIIWQNHILKSCQEYPSEKIPLVINSKEIFSEEPIIKTSPTGFTYSYSLASKDQISLAIKTANKKETSWLKISLEERKTIIAKAASIYRKKRSDFIKIMMLDSAKSLIDADREISESIDMMEYYLTRITKLINMQDVEIAPKGTIFIISARAFPYSSPIGRIVAALISQNCVVFKPPPDTILTAWHLVKALWEAGIPKDVLQFVSCSDEITLSSILPDKRIAAVILSGKHKTVEKFLEANPLQDLIASSEGKNSMIISAVSDHSLAVKNLIKSAFTFSGQQYSSVSLAILEEEVYNNPTFRKNLIDATLNLKVGPIWDAETDIGPLIKDPDEDLIKALTTLENQESWLIKPKQDPNNPLLWSPGIKLGITINSSFYKKFLPGPVLGLMKAKNFEEALIFANKTQYGLCASLQSLDDEEHLKWKQSMEAGNLYINTPSIESVIRRQPFGGFKKSCFGKGFKAGGPNYLLECIVPKQKGLPKEKKPVNEQVNALTSFLQNIDLSAEELGLWYASIANYTYWWHKMSYYRDPTKIIGQDNFFGYSPLKGLVLRVTKEASPLDVLRICAAALTCKAFLELSFDSSLPLSLNWDELKHLLPITDETEEEFLNRLSQKKIKRIRLASKAEASLKIVASKNLCYLDDASVLANGRYELLHYLREVSITYDYHRYGTLGVREGELRKPSI